MLVSSCVGFVWWLNRPGELLEPARLRGSDTTAYVEWTLRLDDPGTGALVEDLLDGLSELQEQIGAPLPPGIADVLNEMQNRRNEREFRQLFPCVVAWSVVGDDGGGEDLHLVSVSIEKLGNRMVFIDWVMGLFVGRSPEVDVVRHGGEKIYVLREPGSAFFLRRSDFIFTSDADTARRAVDRLVAQREETEAPSGIEPLLADLPPEHPLRGASLNRNDEIRRLFEMVTGDDERGVLDALDWDRVRAMTFSGGFTEQSSFAALVTLDTDAAAWHADELAALERVVRRVFELDASATQVALDRLDDRIVVRIELDDLPSLVRRRLALDGR
ncbi:MAG TPA: hypothetical protein VD788_11720 [Candidatus Polarisedimenticolaceae bacterium]|nr:hypothetical protein [Candidatus Polarisedimenticolaceae bacterium]